MCNSFRNFREWIKRVPIAGSLLYECYLRLLHREGEILTIRQGALSGKRWVRYMRTFNEKYIAGNYEKPVQTALEKYLRPNMVFYDVGANAGFFSLLGAALVGPKGRVVAFEPHPLTAKQLKRQMSINNMQHVDVVVAAVSNKVGMARLSDDTSADMLSLVNSQKAVHTIEVKTTTIDAEIKSHPLPDLIKIDVEGGEINVLRGARALIEAKRPVLLVEIHSGQIAIQYDELMAAYRYQTEELTEHATSAAGTGVRFVVSCPVRDTPARITDPS
jgi:FkbM family methyltransferase